jgi:hypothetical protein
MQTLCTTANTIWDLSSKTRISLPRQNIHLQQIWYQLQCPSVQPFLLISHNLLHKSDIFLTSPAIEQLRMTDSISKVSSCCSVLEKTNLIMTHGFFTTSFMLPGLICRSLEIRAYCTCKETHQLISWRTQRFVKQYMTFMTLIRWRLWSFSMWHYAPGRGCMASHPSRQ